MSNIKKIITWMPRISALMIVFVLSLFATESLNSHAPLGTRTLELFLQLCPALIVLIITIFVWKYPGYGAYLFTLLGLVFLVYFDHETVIDYFTISGPIFLTSGLFILSKILNIKKQNNE